MILWHWVGSSSLGIQEKGRKNFLLEIIHYYHPHNNNNNNNNYEKIIIIISIIITMIIIIIRIIIISSFRQEASLLSGRRVGIAIWKCESFSHSSCRGNAYRLSLIHAQPCSWNTSVIEMLDSQETKKLAIYKHDFSPRVIILKAVYYKGNKKCYTTHRVQWRIQTFG